MSSLILEIIRHGKVIAVGTDKSNAPGFVKEFASHIGAKVIGPDFDLTRKEKRKIASKFADNRHEIDALASAMYAYKRIKPFLNKLGIHLKNVNREDEFYYVVNMIMAKKANSISVALES